MSVERWGVLIYDIMATMIQLREDFLKKYMILGVFSFWLNISKHRRREIERKREKITVLIVAMASTHAYIVT